MQGGQALVTLLERAGIDYVFCSPGTEWPPVWEALAELKKRGVEAPSYINCRHEALAVGMAAAYTKVTGKPQAVLLHATVGPLNAAMFLRAAYQERVPMIVCAGESAAYGEHRQTADPGGQWLHDLSDLGGSADLLRRCVKWSDRITSPSILASTVQRAIQIAQEPPAGPVLLGVPFEWMLGDMELSDDVRPNVVARPVGLDEKAIEQAADLLLNAKSPLVVTEYLGRDVKAVERLVELCELLAIPVMESHRPAFLNFPRTHPLYLRYDREDIEAVDLILIAEAVSPWYPASKGPKPGTKVLLIAEEFPNSRLPFWGYNVDLGLVGAPAAALEKLVDRIRGAKQYAANRSRYEERFRRFREKHEQQANALRDEAEEHSRDVPVDPRWLCHVLNEAIPEDAVIVEETTVHRTLIQNMVRRTQPMSYIARITGGLGVGLGYALGAKLAMKGKPVFALLGDGAFHYNPVAACLGLSQEYNLPLVIVLFNNQRYGSMERGLLKYFPEGTARKSGLHYGSPIAPNPDYRLFAEIYGGYGIKVANPTEIESAIKEALEHARQGRLALVDVVLSDYTPR